jgi:hypothetical protein
MNNTPLKTKIFSSNFLLYLTNLNRSNAGLSWFKISLKMVQNYLKRRTVHPKYPSEEQSLDLHRTEF